MPITKDVLYLIPLTRGHGAIVDADIYKILVKMKWHAQIKSDGKVVAARAFADKTRKNKQRFIFMHRFIMDAPAGVLVDHINGNTLDNRRENLRLCTNGQNKMNARPSRNAAFPYKGVWKDHTCKNRYRATITAYGVQYYLGGFDSPEEAALAYNKAAIKYHGEFARLNEVACAKDL